MLRPRAVILACAALAVCGDPPSLTGEEAGRLFATVDRQLGSGRHEATASLMPIDFTEPCPAGGERHFVGEGVRDAKHLEFTAEFDACGFDGLIVTGVIDYLQVRTTTDGVTETSNRHTGELRVDGEITGTCVVDREWIVGVEGETRKGSVCGHAFDTLPSGAPP